VGEVWGQFWLLESLESFETGASWVFAITLFTVFQDFNKSFQRLAGMGAGLSTRQNSCNGLVNVGAGLPTQQNDRGFHFWLLFIVQNIFSELHSLSWGHCFEEGLHPSHLCFDQLSFGRLRTVSGIVSFLSAHVTRSLYMYSVSPAWHVGRSCGIQSTSHRVGPRWACVRALA